MKKKLPISERLQELIAMLEDEAVELIENKWKYRARIVERDGKHYILTMGLRNDRVNLSIKYGIVVKATIG